MSTTRNLVDALISGDSLAIEDTFDAAMSERISSKLDDMKMDIAANMFRTQEEQEPVSSDPFNEE